jgi:SAM-dependent methyltransferase
MAFRTWASAYAGGAVSTAMAGLNARHPWSHNDHFHRWILTNLPAQRRAALDVGCGQGALVATLAPHFTTVTGNDADPGMRADAAGLCADLPGVTIDGGDWTRLDGPLDLVTMVARPAALRRVGEVLAPGGRFLAVGLAPPRTVSDHFWDVASIVANPVIGFAKHPRVNRAGVQPPAYPVQDPTTTYDELRGHVERAMPGATMRHRLGFRHTIAWTRPA